MKAHLSSSNRRRLDPEGLRVRAGYTCVMSRMKRLRQRDLTALSKMRKTTVRIATTLVEIGALAAGRVGSSVECRCGDLELLLLSEE
ncbi:hypothetical protein AB8B21_03315 [Tardiphaga sp. 866_E4_N2_1]|uniref:hypothetical protein n=1 Tax=unclassified Tardiphaga TaxID=2631404 RepID=UPI003F26F59F